MILLDTPPGQQPTNKIPMGLLPLTDALYIPYGKIGSRFCYKSLNIFINIGIHFLPPVFSKLILYKLTDMICDKLLANNTFKAHVLHGKLSNIVKVHSDSAELLHKLTHSRS